MLFLYFCFSYLFFWLSNPQLITQADVQLDEEHAKRVSNHREVCLKKFNVDPVLLEKARKGDFSDNSDFRKHVFCVSQQIGYIDDSGKVVHDVFKTKVSEVLNGKAEEMMNTCLSKSEDPIELAVATTKCFYDVFHLVIL